ncbi:hypothetical protein AO1008_10304 [Aspergillus oryzae 100-8]|uniref:Uncharacterized protein n=1 Tax=Aspergillus oryzae (strain 3.042) TaxID=1160506 RepID=I8IJZ4_ASPO3|nr:hypothetical protein Ao3042_04315 [Aspergillus oryzae 3.042]KDE83715.1 hypothetical protein AO1008_10304 [Aspergillus oryzae 100-8]|eukprot:EIT79236.1 hypothetical protein Ao3042_04315 [Aspergillus oryzae 3.042]
MKPPRTTFVYFILRGLLKLNATKVLLASVFLWLTAYEFCRLRYWRDPHSAFFDGRNAYEWKYSLYREHEARRLIAGHNAPSDPYVLCQSKNGSNYMRLVRDGQTGWVRLFRGLGRIFVGRIGSARAQRPLS